MSWIDVGAVDDIPLRGGATGQNAGWVCGAVSHSRGRGFAASNTCPHKQGPLAEGIVHGQKITCPLHNWVFDLNTGEAEG